MKLVFAALGLGASLLATAALGATAGDDVVKEACSVDFAKYCPNADDERAYRHCARSHFFRLSRPCRHVLMHYRSQPKDESEKPSD